jgi:hypothetical protein
MACKAAGNSAVTIRGAAAPLRGASSSSSSTRTPLKTPGESDAISCDHGTSSDSAESTASDPAQGTSNEQIPDEVPKLLISLDRTLDAALGHRNQKILHGPL